MKRRLQLLAALYIAGSAGSAVAQPVDAPAQLEHAAQGGDGRAAYRLGLMYRNGKGVERDSAAAAHWMAHAAGREVPEAMFLFANMLLGGEGVARDEAAARRWIERAAERDYPEAVMQMALGLMDGSMGFERDAVRAEIYMKEAAHALRHRQQ